MYYIIIPLVLVDVIKKHILPLFKHSIGISISYIWYTVSPNNGHVGGMASVRCRELSASRHWSIFIKTPNMPCPQPVRYSETPL